MSNRTNHDDGGSAQPTGVPSKERLLQWLLILGWMFLQFYFKDSYVGKVDHKADLARIESKLEDQIKEADTKRDTVRSDCTARFDKLEQALKLEAANRAQDVSEAETEQVRLHEALGRTIHNIELTLQRLEMTFGNHVEVDARQYEEINGIKSDLRAVISGARGDSGPTPRSASAP